MDEQMPGRIRAWRMPIGPWPRGFWGCVDDPGVADSDCTLPTTEYTLLPPGSVVVDGERLRQHLLEECVDCDLRPGCTDRHKKSGPNACIDNMLAYLTGKQAGS